MFIISIYILLFLYNLHRNIYIFFYPRIPCSRRDSPHLRWLPIHSVDHAMSEQEQQVHLFYISMLYSYILILKSSGSMATKEIH